MTSSSEKQQQVEEWPDAIIIERKPQDDPIRPLHYYVFDGTQSTDFSDARRYALATQQSGDGLEQVLADTIEAAKTIASFTHGRSESRTLAEAKESIERAEKFLAASRASGGGGE